MPFYFNSGIQSVADARVSIKRIEVSYLYIVSMENKPKIIFNLFYQDFLLLDEISINKSFDNSSRNKRLLNESTIEFDKVTTKWFTNKPSDNEPNALIDVSFKVSSGQLLAVAGITGSGKAFFK